jgi:flagellar hook-length control protein FliK
MDFAADAVFDVVAPPARPANARPAADRDASEPSFDDHLDAATAEDAPREERAKPTENAKANEDTESETPALEADGAPTPEPPAPPHIVQIVPLPTPIVSDVAADVDTAAPQPMAPIEAEAAPQAPPTSEPVAAPIASPDAPTSAEKADAGQSDSKADATVKSAAAATPQQADAAEANNAAANAQTQTQASATTAAAPAPLPTTESPPPDLATISAPAAPVDRQAAPQRTSKAEPQRGAKSFEVAPQDGETEAPQTSSVQSQRSAPATPASKDAASSLLVLQADAPEIPAPSAQQSGTPLTQATAQTQQTASVDHSAAVRAMPAATQVAREIVRRFDGDNTTFELRLDPPELGRVEVRLDVSRDHRVTAVISADSPQALTELSRHARDLEQMLNDAGLQLSDSGLSFDLRQGSENAADADETGSRTGSAERGDDATQQQTSTAARPLGFERWRGVRVDVTV